MHWTVHLEGGPQRVNHAAVAIDNMIYSFGGYSSSEGDEVTENIDIYVLNTGTLRWSRLHYKHSTLGAIPYKRYGHTVVSYERKIYLWGGRNNLSASNILHCFDVDTCTWTVPPTTGKPPLAADGHSACLIKDHMYIFGGFQDDTEKFACSVHRLNLKTLEWQEVKTHGMHPVGRDFHTTSAIGDKMYVFGGRSPRESLNDQIVPEFYPNEIMYLNVDTMMWHTPATFGDTPCGRRSHSAVVYDDKIYVIGGYNGNTQSHLNDVHEFDTGKNQWSRVNCLGKGPCPRRRHCACLIGRELFLFGGSSPRIEGEKLPVPTENLFQKLIDHSDLHVLDFSPSLKRLCQLKVIEYGLNMNLLPKYLIKEMQFMMTNNNITRNEFFPRKDYGVFSFSA